MVSVIERVMDEIKEEDVVQLTQSLVRIPSVKPEEGSEKMASFLVPWLKAIGLNVQVIEVNRIKTIHASLKGQEESTGLLFFGHTDVAPIGGDKWTFDPFSGEIEGRYLWGRGSSDMKGALAAMLIATKAIVKAKVRLRNNLRLLFEGDEESGSHNGLQHIMTHNPDLLRTEAVIFGEATELQIPVACKGHSVYEIISRGKRVHSSIAELGVNAIDKMAKVLARQHEVGWGEYKKHNLLGSPIINVQMIEGGFNEWSVPEKCKVQLEARLVPGQSPDDIKMKIEENVMYLKKTDKDIDIEVRLIRRDEAFEIPIDAPVVKILKEAGKVVLGNAPAIVGNPGGGGMHLRAFTKYGGFGIKFGPGTRKYIHNVDERISIDNLVNAAKIYAGAIVLACT